MYGCSSREENDKAVIIIPRYNPPRCVVKPYPDNCQGEFSSLGDMLEC